MKSGYIISMLPLLAATATAEELIISNNAIDAKTISNSIVRPTGDWTASNVSASMRDILFTKSTPQRREDFGNAASLSSVACSMGGEDTFRYSLTWTTQVANGGDALNLNKIAVDWALLRLHNNTVIGTVTYDGEGVLHSYDLSFNYKLSSADGSQVWQSSAPITVSIGSVAERDNYMCSNSGNIYKDGISFADTPDTVMSAARGEILFSEGDHVQLFDDTSYTLTLTLAGVKEHDTGLDFELNDDVRTRYGWGVAHEWTYAAVGNVMLSGTATPGPHPTPEPATATLSLLALGALMARRKRK